MSYLYIPENIIIQYSGIGFSSRIYYCLKDFINGQEFDDFIFNHLTGELEIEYCGKKIIIKNIPFTENHKINIPFDNTHHKCTKFEGKLKNLSTQNSNDIIYHFENNII